MITDITNFKFNSQSTNEYSHIIKNIFNQIGTTNRNFVEFVNPFKLNIHSMFLKSLNWNGIVLNIHNDETKEDIINYKITKDNINSYFNSKIIPDHFDLLILNSNLYDFWLWTNLFHSPALIMIPFNPLIKPPNSKVIIYNENIIYDNNISYNSSFSALTKLGKNKGYVLVGSSPYYLFFVKEYLIDGNFKLQKSINKYFIEPNNSIKYNFDEKIMEKY